MSTVRISARVTEEQAERLKSIGGGDISRGVRMASGIPPAELLQGMAAVDVKVRVAAARKRWRISSQKPSVRRKHRKPFK